MVDTRTDVARCLEALNDGEQPDHLADLLAADVRRRAELPPSAERLLDVGHDERDDDPDDCSEVERGRAITDPVQRVHATSHPDQDQSAEQDHTEERSPIRAVRLERKQHQGHENDRVVGDVDHRRTQQ
jgi:hypothetical protein